MTTRTKARTNGSAPTAAAPWRNRITGSGLEDPAQLLANPGNWRIHPAVQRNALRGSLDTVGWVQQVMVNTVTGHLVDGHARVEEALSRGEKVPVLYVDLSPEEEALVLATLDPIGAMATTDEAKLNELLADVTVDDAGLLRLLQGMGSQRPLNADPDELPEDTGSLYVSPGDIGSSATIAWRAAMPPIRRWSRVSSTAPNRDS